VNTKHEAVAQLAYQLWHGRGCPADSSDEDWFEAERRLSADADSTLSSKVDESVEQTFPASDPPASHLPDRPPSNAADKWKASTKPATAGRPNGRR
jgi:hypothetical protein